MRNMKWLLFAALVVAAMSAVPARAAEKVVTIPTRDGVTVKLLESADAGATAPVAILLTGGDGKVNLDGWDGSGNPTGNFVIRTRRLYTAQGFDFAAPDVPSDRSNLSRWRTSEDHARDIAAVIAHIRTFSSGPVFLVGTSRGTISAAGVAAHLKAGLIAGIVLTSSVTRDTNKGNKDKVPDVDLGAIRVPVLFVHNKDDACYVCVPGDIPDLARKFTAAPSVRIEMVEGGGPWRGDECGPHHAHGYQGIEREVVGKIAAWMKTVAAGGKP